MKKFLAVLLMFVGTCVFAQSTTTPNIGLQVPPTGSNNWGVALNYNFQKLDQLLSGNLSLPALNVTGAVTLPGLVITQAQINAALGFTPLNPANNLNDVASPSTALQNLGGIGAGSIKGEWSNIQTYNITNVVLYKGGSYISLVNSNNGNEPDISPSKWAALVTPEIQTISVSLRVASGIAIQTGNTQSYLQVPYSGTIVGWSIIADQPGSIAIDVWKVASSVPPVAPTIPTSSNIISGTSPITLSSAQSAASTTLTAWSTTSVNQYDVFGFNIASASTVQSVSVQIFIQKD